MDNLLQLAASNLSSPIVLFFALGILITLIRAKVEFPAPVSDFITIYLLLAIGFKGGVAIAQVGLNSILTVISGALFLGAVIPVYSFFVLWRLGKLKSDDAAAIAGHYGSISVVTFIAASAFLTNMGIGYEGYVNGLPAIMEVPAIGVALVLASWAKKQKAGAAGEEVTLGQVLKQVVLSKSVVLLLGAMGVGYVTGPKGAEGVKFFYEGLFMGMLSFFMLEMGMVAAGKLGDLRRTGVFLALFGIVMPPVNALLGILIGVLVGLSVGGTTLLGVLAASSSYIVAPAAMRISLPKANPALYLGASIGVTLPFNLIAGIPIYYYAARYLSELLSKLG